MRNGQVLPGKGERRCFRKKKGSQLPIVLRAYLLRKEDAARLQQTGDLPGRIVPVAVEDQVEGGVGERERPAAVRFPEVDPERGEGFPAESGIGRVRLRGAGPVIGMAQRQQKLAAAGVDVQNPGFRAEKCSGELRIVPGRGCGKNPSRECGRPAPRPATGSIIHFASS